MEETKIKIPLRLTLSVVAAFLICFCGLLTETALNVAFPTIIEEMHVSTATVQWLTTANLLVVAMICPLAAFLQKRFRLRSLFCFSVLAYVLGCVIAILTPNFALLLVARVIQGIATGIGVPLAFSIVLEQIPHQRTGLYMGFGSLVTSAAPALGPTFGGIVSSMIGWRNIFTILIPILVFTLVLGLCTIRNHAEKEKAPIDIGGAVSIMAAFFCLVYGFANIDTIRSRWLLEIIFFAAGAVFILLFARHCSRCSQPLIDISIFRNVPFVCHLVAFFLLNAVILGTSFLLPNYLQVSLGYISMAAGLAVLPGAALTACTAPFGGRILDRRGPRFPVLCGTIIMLTATLLFALFSTRMSLPTVVVIYILFGFGSGMGFGDTMTTGINHLDIPHKTFGNTAFNTLLQFAGAVGTCVAAACVSFSQTSNANITYEAKTASGTQHGFLFLLVLVAFSLVFQIIGLRKSKSAS